MKKLSPWALLGLVATPLAAAQDREAPAREIPNAQAELTQWRAKHGDVWRAAIDAETGFAEMIFGGNVAPTFRPIADHEWIAVAREFVTESARLHGIDAGTLVHDETSVKLLPLGIAHQGTDKMTVELRQMLGSIPVVGASTNVLMDMEGRLLSVQSTASPFLAEVDPRVSYRASDALVRANDVFEERYGLVPTFVEDPELVVIQAERGGLRLPYLAWEIDIGWRVGGIVPEIRRYWIDAHNGTLVRDDDQVHHFDVGGTLDSMATPGTRPDKANNPEVPLRMPYARITAGGNTTHTDRNGVWNFAGLNGPLACLFEYRGLFNRVLNEQGAEYTLNVNAATGNGNAILMNPTSADLVTAAANAYLHVNTVRDFVRDTDPTDAHADFMALSNVNISSTCNAFFDGQSVNYYLAGGGCVNTAYTTVIAHEYGHWLNVLYGTGNGGDGMGEGNGDVWAMYTFDDPVVGFDFCGVGCFVRTGNNNRQFCGDNNPGCHGGVHNDGEVWMGAAWKVRDRLNVALGNAAGDLVADTLFLGWMNGYNQSQIKSVIETQWLTLDDNDGNIGNGTPHYQQIDGGFRQQGFPGFDLDFVQFSNVVDLPDTQDEAGPYLVGATLQALINPPIQSATIHYRVNGGTFNTVAMSPTGGNNWAGSIPNVPAPAEVDYYLTAVDNQGNDGEYPPDAPDATLSFRIGVLTTFLVTQFEAANNEGWTVGDTNDNATTGIWTRVNPNGTAAQPEDDHTPPNGTICWVTGQGSPGGGVGDNDVDGGRTTLKSPVFDASGMTNPKISYWRWYSNTQGAAPNQDTFVIDISNNGGSTWTNVEIVGPTGPQADGGWYRHEFYIADEIAPTATMQLRFVASDLGSGSIVEAAIDDIEGYDLSDGCTNPANYGTGKTNSQLINAEITATGSNSFSVNDLAFETTTLIGNQAAVLMSGSQAANTPFFGGTLYVGGGIVREALVFLDSGGYVSVPFPIAQSDIGTKRFFQFWYRDPMHSDGTGVGLTNGIEVLFCD